MARPLAISSFVLSALGLVILAYLASLTKDDGLDAMNQQINQLIEQEKFQEAIPIAERAVAVAKRVRGSEEPETVDTLNNLGFLFQKIGEYAKAEPLYREVLRIRLKVLGPEDPDTDSSVNNLPFGPKNLLFAPAAAESLANLALLYNDMCEYSKAEPLYQEALRIYQKTLGPQHPVTAISLNNLALLEFDLGRIEEATALARQASAAELTVLSKMFSFTSEEQRLAYLDIFRPYGLFPFLKGTETDLAKAVLRYKGIVLDSIIEDRLLAEASQGSQDQIEQLNLDKRELELLLHSARKLSAETNQRIEALQAEVNKIVIVEDNLLAGASQGSEDQMDRKRHTIYTPSTPSNRRAFLLDCRDDSKPRGPWGGSDEAVQRSSGWCLISKQADYARTSSVGITVNPGDLFSPEWGRSC